MGHLLGCTPEGAHPWAGFWLGRFGGASGNPLCPCGLLPVLTASQGSFIVDGPQVGQNFP